MLARAAHRAIGKRGPHRLGWGKFHVVAKMMPKVASKGGGKKRIRREVREKATFIPQKGRADRRDPRKARTTGKKKRGGGRLRRSHGKKKSARGEKRASGNQREGTSLTRVGEGDFYLSRKKAFNIPGETRAAERKKKRRKSNFPPPVKISRERESLSEWTKETPRDVVF